MVNKNQENLKELFEKFLSAEQAAEAVEDVRKAEQILCENPAPEPDDMLIANIKAEIALHLLPHKTTTFKHIFYRAITIAAAIIVVVSISLDLLQNGKSPETAVKLEAASIIPRAIWESNNIASDDTKLVIFTTEAEQINDEFSTLRLGRSEASMDNAVTELEMELMEIQGDFWKG